MAVAQTQLTLEEFLKLPEEESELEFADGMVSQKVSPKGKHSRLQSQLVKHLDRAASTDESALVFPELRTTFSGASRVPDISVYRRDRVPVDETGQIANDFWEPPDIAIEIVSPEQSVNGLVRRCMWFVNHGVGIALLIDPQDESILRFQGGHLPVAIRGDERIDAGDVLPDFDLTAKDLFDSLRVR